MDVHSEPAFSLACDRGIVVSGDEDPGRAADFLAHAIARQPANLRRHVQRINLCFKHSDQSALGAALLDLFIGLGANGRPLRERLLKKCDAVLDPAIHAFLQQHLSTGLAATDALPDMADSMLSKGITGDATAIIVAAGENPSDRDYVAEAQSYIEYDQLELAQSTLEEGILQQPGQLQLHQDLLELYQYTDDRDAFRATLRELQRLHSPFIEMWREETVFTGRRGGTDGPR